MVFWAAQNPGLSEKENGETQAHWSRPRGVACECTYDGGDSSELG